MDKMFQEINLDTDALRAQLYTHWIGLPSLTQGQLAKQIGIAEYSLRLFLDKGTNRRYTKRTKMKIYKWLQDQGKVCTNQNS